MEVDLSKARNGSDDQVREAIFLRSSRDWLYRQVRREDEATDLKRLGAALFPHLHKRF